MSQSSINTFDILHRAAQREVAHHERYGQALMNALAELYPEVENQIAGTTADPYHDNSLVPSFWQRIAELSTVHQTLSGRNNRQMGAFKAKRTKRIKQEIDKAKLRGH